MSATLDGPALETVELAGHIIDSLILAKVLDVVLARGSDYRLVDVEVGRTNLDSSRVLIEITSPSSPALAALLEELQVHGVNRLDHGEAELATCDRDGVLPAGFYSTTNLETAVFAGGTWHEVENPEMDCAIVLGNDATARTVPMHRVRVGDAVVVGHAGVRVEAPHTAEGTSTFEFMNSEVSSEKPKALQVRELAGRVREARAEGGKVLVVAGPAVVHTGATPDLAQLVRAGYVDVLFAGNGFATHDIESNVLGTSLGVSLRDASPTEGGHSNHLRAINEIRRHGSIAAAVESGYLAGGVMYECVKAGVPFVLGGSVRDDGPLPDVYSDTVAATDALRALIPGVTLAVMLASTLHAIATGNLLRASVETYCVDINQSVVTKLADRGSHQAHGIVTDVGLFVRELAAELAAAHPVSTLSWGRRYLMCPPEYFSVAYEINPWMHTTVAVDRERAVAQWERLVATLREAGATVEILTPVDSVPDLVFTANAGIVSGRRFVPARFSHPERQAESPHDIAYFAAAGYGIDELPEAVRHEGAGDALPFGGVLFSGYRFRSDAGGAGPALSDLLGVPVRTIELTDERLYHFDLTFCPLDDRRALVAPLGWDHYGYDVVTAAVPEPFVLDDDEALAFCANSVVVGTTIVMPSCPPRVGRALESFGFDVAVCEMSEFLKAGGGCRCLTLALDVDLATT